MCLAATTRCFLRAPSLPLQSIPLVRAASEPVIRYGFAGIELTLDDYLNRQSVTTGLLSRALAGFDRKELVTIPPVPDVAAWDALTRRGRFGGRLRQLQARRAIRVVAISERAAGTQVLPGTTGRFCTTTSHFVRFFALDDSIPTSA